LAPVLIARRLVELTMTMAVSARDLGIVATVTLHGTAAGPTPLLDAYARSFAVAAAVQDGEDLGTRMRNALFRSLACDPAAILIGTDCPALTPAYLSKAAAALARVDAVFGPAEDGGYVLV